MSEWIELDIAFGTPPSGNPSLEVGVVDLLLGCLLEANSQALLDIRLPLGRGGGVEVRFGDPPREAPFRWLLELGSQFSSGSWAWISWEDFVANSQQGLMEEVTRHEYASRAASRFLEFRDCCPDVYQCLHRSSARPLAAPERAVRRICPATSAHTFSRAAAQTLVHRAGAPTFTAFNGRIDDMATFPLRDEGLREKVIHAIIRVIWATVNGTASWWETGGSDDRGEYLWLSGSDVVSLETLVEASPPLPDGEGNAQALEELLASLDQHYVRLVVESARAWGAPVEQQARSLLDRLLRRS